jgi:hypothetical protein
VPPIFLLTNNSPHFTGRRMQMTQLLSIVYFPHCPIMHISPKCFSVASFYNILNEVLQQH